MLLKYVREVQPALVEQFVESGPPAVVAAMKNTITNMLGTLPPQFFTVTISTVGENMSQLMLSVMMTGYLFRNAQYRLELRNALGDAASMRSSSSRAASLQPSSSTSSSALLQGSQSAPAQGSVLDEEAYAPGVQKSRVQVGSDWDAAGAHMLAWHACRMACMAGSLRAAWSSVGFFMWVLEELRRRRPARRQTVGCTRPTLIVWVLRLACRGTCCCGTRRTG